MSEQKHTPEPWVIYGRGIDGPLDGLGYKQIVVYQVDRKEDARRIVACVNACAGMSDEAMALAVENGGMKAVIGFARGLESQRDQLLGVLKTLMACLDPHDYPDEQSAAKAAIQSIEESMK